MDVSQYAPGRDRRLGTLGCGRLALGVAIEGSTEGASHAQV